MTAIRKEAIELLERIPDDKLVYIIQIMQGINGLFGVSESEPKIDIDLERFAMSENAKME